MPHRIENGGSCVCGPDLIAGFFAPSLTGLRKVRHDLGVVRGGFLSRYVLKCVADKLGDVVMVWSSKAWAMTWL